MRPLLAITPTPTPLPVSPMARPRRETWTADPAMPGAGTQIMAPPNPARTIPTTRTGTDGASVSTDRPAVVNSRPRRTAMAGASRPAVRLTSSVPARYAVRLSVPISPATAYECTRSAFRAGSSSAYPKRPKPWATAAARTRIGRSTRGPCAEVSTPPPEGPPPEGRTGAA